MGYSRIVAPAFVGRYAPKKTIVQLDGEILAISDLYKHTDKSMAV
jgi:hypothetical protein